MSNYMCVSNETLDNATTFFLESATNEMSSSADEFDGAVVLQRVDAVHEIYIHAMHLSATQLHVGASLPTFDCLRV